MWSDAVLIQFYLSFSERKKTHTFFSSHSVQYKMNVHVWFQIIHEFAVAAVAVRLIERKYFYFYITFIYSTYKSSLAVRFDTLNSSPDNGFCERDLLQLCCCLSNSFFVVEYFIFINLILYLFVVNYKGRSRRGLLIFRRTSFNF